MSLDTANLTRIFVTRTPFIMSRGVRFGFKGEELLDYLQEVGLQLSRAAEKWPEKVDSELALIRKHADTTAIDMVRNRKALKRDAPAVSFNREDGRDLAEMKCGGALRIAALQEELFDIRLIHHAIRVVAATLSPELERIIVARLRNGDCDDYSKNENARALRAFREALSIPREAPRDAGVSDSADHLIRTSLRIEAAAKAPSKHFDTQEVTCVNDVLMTSNRARESNRNSERHEMSNLGHSPSRTLWSATAAAINTSHTCESTPTPSSQSQQSGFAHSRRQVPSASTSTTTASRRSARRAEPTLVTRQTFESSATGSSG